MQPSLTLFLPEPAVVPIFVNAGAALFPAIIAGIASVGALLLKPKELLALFKKKPWIPVLVVAIGAGLWFGGGWIFGEHAPAAPAAAAQAAPGTAGRDTTDWTEIAKALIQAEASGTSLATLDPTTALTGPTGTTALTGPGSVPGGSGFLTGLAAAVAPGIGFRMNALRNGYDGKGSPIELTPALNWAKGLPEGTWVLSSPTVVGDRVYFATCRQDNNAFVGEIVCANAKTGTQIWSTNNIKGQRMKAFFSSPVLSPDGKYLVIGQGLHTDDNSSLICLDAQTGVYKWHIQTPLHVEGSPAIYGDMVIAGAGAIEEEGSLKPRGGIKGIVFASSLSKGKPLTLTADGSGKINAPQTEAGTFWLQEIVDPESSPAVADGIAYIGSGVNGNAVYALNIDPNLPAEKRILWRTDAPYAATGAVTVAGDMVLIGGGSGDYVKESDHPQGMVMALDRKTGKQLWRKNLGNTVLGAVAVAGNVAVVTGWSGKVTALDLNKQGAVLWETGINGSGIPAAAAFTGKYAYAVTNDGALAVIRASDGKLMGAPVVLNDGDPGAGQYCVSSPTVANGCVYVGSEMGGLVCLKGAKVE